MIQKTTKIICDNCGQGIYDFVEDLTYREIAETCKEKSIAVVRYKVGSRIPLTFCDEKCFKEYEERYLKEREDKNAKTRKATSCTKMVAHTIKRGYNGGRK